MRCDDVTRELSVPDGGGYDPAELHRHLAGCARCAAWAYNSRRLDRLWAATRPSEPPPGTFDELWTRVSQVADAGPDVLTLPPPSPWRRTRWGAAIGGLAAAAAVLLAFLGPRETVVSPPNPDTSRPAPP